MLIHTIGLIFTKSFFFFFDKSGEDIAPRTPFNMLK